MRVNSRRLISIACLVILFCLVSKLFAGKSFFIPLEMLRPFRDSSDGSPGVPPGMDQDISRSAPAYAPGLYMAGQRPSNDTFCRWNYGLPAMLAYPAGKLTGSPQARERGPYRILPHVIRGNNQDGRHVQRVNLTLCTHATAEQVYHVVELARRWEGLLSLAIFAPGVDAGLAVSLLERACRCEPEMSKVSVHLVFPAGRPPALNARIQPGSIGDCAASDLQPCESDTERRQRSMTYPINVARNVARHYSTTSRVLVSDIELLPSEKLATGFLKMIEGRSPRAGVVFVVPSFEIDSREKPPKNKRELMAALRNGLAVYFHRFVCIHCQRFPGLTKWILRPDPGSVRPFIITRREFPYQRWEPIFIGTKDDPMYNEEMSWEGRQDKMGQMFEMCLMNYRLIVLDGAFLVHTPGIKHKSSNAEKENEASSTLARIREQKKNSRVYQSLMRNLLKQYPSNRRCKK